MVCTAALSFFLAACAYKDREVSKDYVGRDLAGRTLAVIFPDSGRIEVGNPKDLAASFPREPAEPANAVLAEEFGESFFAGLERHIDYVKPLRVHDSVPPPPADQRFVFKRDRSMDVPSHEFDLPTLAHLRSQGVETDLVLIVDALKSSTGKQEIVSPKFGGSVNETFLVVEGWYVIWDYAKDKPISHGRFRPQTAYKREMGADIWMSAFGKAAKMVVEKSPFKGPKWYND